jgi:hypothetical protein
MPAQSKVPIVHNGASRMPVAEMRIGGEDIHWTEQLKRQKNGYASAQSVPKQPKRNVDEQFAYYGSKKHYEDIGATRAQIMYGPSGSSKEVQAAPRQPKRSVDEQLAYYGSRQHHEDIGATQAQMMAKAHVSTPHSNLPTGKFLGQQSRSEKAGSWWGWLRNA